MQRSCYALCYMATFHLFVFIPRPRKIYSLIYSLALWFTMDPHQKLSVIPIVGNDMHARDYIYYCHYPQLILPSANFL